MKTTRRQFLKACAHVMAGLTLTGVGLYQYGTRIEPERLTIEHIEIPLKKLKPALEGFKLVQISDIHIDSFTQIGIVEKAAAAVNQLKPDLIVLTGDYVTRQAEAILELAPVVASLNARYGIVAILGNHELWTNAAYIQDRLKQVGFSVLVNEGLPLAVGKETIYLAGVDDYWSGQPDLQAALANAPADTPTILLAHEPDVADIFSLDGRVSLQLSGHSHGGQVRLPGRGAIVLPPYGRKYDQGLYQVNGMWLYTNRGLGLGPVPYRLNCPPEITEITLVSA
jgi:hypothetical protein